MSACIEIDGESYLKYYTLIKCSSSDHQFYYNFFGIALLTIICLVPLLFIIWQRKLSYEPNMKNIAKIIRVCMIYRIGLIRSYSWWSICSLIKLYSILLIGIYSSTSDIIRP